MATVLRSLTSTALHFRKGPSFFKSNSSALSRKLNGPFVPIARSLTSQAPQTTTHQSEAVQTKETPEKDVLYKRMEVEVRGHDAAVLKSYEWFAVTAAQLLGIAVSRTWVPPVFKRRRRALKSAFVHGKHIVHYEFRTYFRVFEYKKLTGSTADTYLEYIQRNLPEGVAMKVTKERVEKLPPYIKPLTKTV